MRVPCSRNILHVLLACVWLNSTHAGSDETPEMHFQDNILPILETSCFKCHGEEKTKGDIDFTQFMNYADVTGSPELWQDVLEVVQAHEMPPEDATPLKYDHRQQLMKWIPMIKADDSVDCTQLASDRTQKFFTGYVMSRRLTKHEYNNTMRDLFGIDIRPGDILPNDGSGGEGFDNNGSTLFSSSLAIEKYLEAADLILNTVLPRAHTTHTPASGRARKSLLAPAETDASSPRTAATAVIRAFARKAYRRPASESEIAGLLTMYDRAEQRGDDFESSIRLALKAILISPHFLFLSEPEPEERGIQPLNSHTLATRLSYFIWASTPDKELLDLADTDALSEPVTYTSQITRMLADPKASSLGERFAIQWLGLEHFGPRNGPDPKRFPEFDEALAASMRGEIVTYFNHIITKDRSLLELIDSDYSFINQRLGRLYDQDHATGQNFQRVRFDDKTRGGLLGMAGIHAANSYPLRTSPVLRGKWILETLLGGTISPPPPNVPALEERGGEITAVSLREELEEHRKNSDCAACHNRMDPLGFGLENYDSLGRWRSEESGTEIDASGILPSGERFVGPAGLKEVLLNQKDRVIRHLVKKMTGYGLGRELGKFDECVINDAMAALELNDYRPSVLIETIAMSLPFRHRHYAEIEENTHDEELANP